MACKYKENITCFVGCILSVLALRMNLDLQEGENRPLLLLESMKSIEIFDVVLFPLLYGFYQPMLKLCKKVEAWCVVPAALFSFFVVMGYSFYRDNSWNLVLGSRFQLLKCLIAFLGYFFLFYFSIIWLFHSLERIHIHGRTKENTKGLVLRHHPFCTCFLILLLAYLPYMILSYPGILSNDSRRQLIEGYCYLHETGSGLKNHHPILHTLLLSSALSAGEAVFGSANAGIFLYSCIQSCLIFAAVSWLVSLLVELNLSDTCVILTLLLCFFWCIRKKDRTAILMTIPLMSFLLICMAGPAYGWYFRYLYSLAACLPAVVLLTLHHTKMEEKKVCSL